MLACASNDSAARRQSFRAVAYRHGVAHRGECPRVPVGTVARPAGYAGDRLFARSDSLGAFRAQGAATRAGRGAPGPHDTYLDVLAWRLAASARQHAVSVDLR